MENFPRDWTNPSKDYLKIERKYKGDREHITDETSLSFMILKGYRLTRNEFSNAVRFKLIVNREDTDKDYKIFMSRWKETESSFGYGL